MHSRVGFRAVVVAELTRQENICAQKGLMLLTEKKSGKKKGRFSCNGKQTRDWISKTDKSSPTVHRELLMITCAIDAHEGRDVMSLNVPNAFIQTSIPKKAKGERIVMKV